MGAASATIRVVVARSPGERQVELSTIELPAGATVQDALRRAGMSGDSGSLSVGVWGRISTLDAPLRDGDRVELYRALTVDPKEARRLRYKRHRDKTAAR